MKKQKKPKVSIVVATYTRPSVDILECLKSIESLRYPNVEVILVDNNPKSPTQYVAVQNGKVVLVDKTGLKQLGVTASRNIGINRSSGDYVFFVDDDAVLDENCLDELVRVAESDESIGIVGPMTFRYSRRSEKWFYSHEDSSEDISDVFMVVGAALMIKRKVLQKIGLFDENFFFYHEEWDLCWRTQEAGYRTVCVNRAYCWHKVPDDEYAKLFSPMRTYYYHRNFFVFAARHTSTIRGGVDFLFRHLIYYAPGCVPGTFVFDSLKEQKLPAVKSYIRGMMDGSVLFAKLSSLKI